MLLFYLNTGGWGGGRGRGWGFMLCQLDHLLDVAVFDLCPLAPGSLGWEASAKTGPRYPPSPEPQAEGPAQGGDAAGRAEEAGPPRRGSPGKPPGPTLPQQPSTRLGGTLNAQHKRGPRRQETAGAGRPGKQQPKARVGPPPRDLHSAHCRPPAPGAGQEAARWEGCLGGVGVGGPQACHLLCFGTAGGWALPPSPVWPPGQAGLHFSKGSGPAASSQGRRGMSLSEVPGLVMSLELGGHIPPSLRGLNPGQAACTQE